MRRAEQTVVASRNLEASDQPHFVIAFQYPEPATIEQVRGTSMFDPIPGGTPTPDMLVFEQMTFGGYSAAQSAGTTQ